jgi:hypothetical protein
VNAAAIIIIVIAASSFLMMRFGKRWLAKINIVVTNRVTGLFAGCFRDSAFSPTWVESLARSTEPQ